VPRMLAGFNCQFPRQRTGSSAGSTSSTLRKKEGREKKKRGRRKKRRIRKPCTESSVWTLLARRGDAANFRQGRKKEKGRKGKGRRKIKNC